ncbi:MAG: hypothetical protein CR972_02070 [Candidatus Moraniibacteriota bacterium]|nr:MAG: hypothetical protein CR972_02070 [Candidatus Moranbacteria bacterium]
MQRKIFIGIDVDVHLKKAITRSVKQWKDLPIKWHKEDSLHISLLSLGWVREDDVLDVIAVLASFCMEHATPFSVDFEKIEAVAKDPKEHDITKAQIVRLIGKESDQLYKLYVDLAEILHVPIEKKKAFKPHIEIGRMRAKKWQNISSYPEKVISFLLNMDVSTITLFEFAHIDGKREVMPIEVFEL